MGKSFALIIAWPDTFCKQAGAWYDSIIQPLGFGTEGYYKVGHAAVVLINQKGDCEYFDFGRYHTPYGKGRVRGVKTDHELKLHTKIEFSEDGNPILDGLYNELNGNQACHGEGMLRAGYVSIDYSKSLSYIQSLQEHDYIPYGPFVKSGTNCSRFVRNVVLKGAQKRSLKVKLRLPWMLTPSPLWNVKSVGEYIIDTENSVEQINSESYEIA